MKAIIDAKKGAKASGGGNSNWTKIGRNSWKNKKTGKLSNDTGLYDRIGEFSDFVIEGKLTEISKEEKAAQFKFKLFLKKGLRLSVKDGEDKLYNYAQELDRLADDEYDYVVDPLFMAVELVQDAGEPGKNNVVKDKEYYNYIKSADKHMKTFIKNAKKCISGLKESVNEAKLPKRFTVKTKQTIDGTVYSPGDYALKKKRAGGGIYLNMDKGEMLGVDAANIAQLGEGKLKQINLREMIYSELFNKLNNGSIK